MCTHCGCSKEDQVSIYNLKDGSHAHNDGSFHHHHHNGEHKHSHEDEAPKEARTIHLEKKILAENEMYAQKNQQMFLEHKIKAINFMSSPGSGKTSLLEKSIGNPIKPKRVLVIEGDQASQNDGMRIKKTGCDVFQINTGKTCHIEAQMVHRSLEVSDLKEKDLVFIENVGNLVCPSLFNLGEHARIVMVSVTEGDDKPIKYPHMFSSADLVILNKIDLLPYLDTSVEAFTGYLRKVNPKVPLICLSVKTGEGMGSWFDWLATP